MSKIAPFLFLFSAALFYLTAFLQSGSRAVYIALGSVFLILGIANGRRKSNTDQK